jgi:hypothetical protein
VVTVTVGAGVAEGGEEFWIHPGRRMQSRNVRKIRGRKVCFIAGNLYHELLTSRSQVLPCFHLIPPLAVFPESRRYKITVVISYREGPCYRK